MSTEIHPVLIAGVRMTTDLLSDEELNAIYMVLLLEQDPKHVIGYDKAKSLFTERDGTKMHHDTQAAFSAIVTERLGA